MRELLTIYLHDDRNGNENENENVNGNGDTMNYDGVYVPNPFNFFAFLIFNKFRIFNKLKMGNEVKCNCLNKEDENEIVTGVSSPYRFKKAV